MQPDAADVVFRRLIDRFPPGRAYGTADFRGGALPEPVAHFLGQALARRLELERDALRAPRTAWFDYGAPAVEAAEARFLDVLAAYARIPADDWPHALEQAVRQVVPHLVQPARTLAAFVFSDGAPVLAVPVIERRMAYFAPYGYLREAVSARVVQKGIAELPAADFANLLQHVERQAPAALGADAWPALLGPLFDTLGEGPGAAVPGGLLALFFAEKGMDAAAARFTAEGRVTLADVPRFLREAGVIRDDDRDDAQDDARLDAAAPAAWRRPDAAPGAFAAPVGRLDEPPPPASRPYALTPPEAPSGPPSPGAEPSAPAYEPAPTSSAPSLWQRLGLARPDAADPVDAAASSEPDDAGARTERAVLGEAAGRRRHFVERLFGGDDAAYDAALRRLEAARTWPDASAILVDAFRAHRVNLYDDTAIAFTDAAEARFLK